MQPAGLRALYDLQERRNASFPGNERVETAHTVRFIDAGSAAGFVLYSDLEGMSDEAIDGVIRAEIGYFAARGLPFEWKLYSHDAPPDLCQRLAAHGFQAGEEETLLICGLDDAPARLFDGRGHTVERLTDPAQIAEVVAVEEQVWGEDKHELAQRLRRDMASDPDCLSVFVARVDGVPVGAAWISYTPDSEFASLWGGSVLEAYRGRGVYGALLAARASEARQRGRHFLMIDAGPMSRPIVAALGFTPVAATWPCALE